MATQLDEGFVTKRHCYNHKLLPYSGGIGFRTHAYLIIKLPHSRVLRLLARSMLLALAIVSFPWIGSILSAGSSGTSVFRPEFSSDPLSLELLPFLFRDLRNEGLLKTGEKALFLSNRYEDAVYDSQIFGNNEMEMEMISSTDLERQNSIPNESFDFTFTHGFHVATEFIDRTLKVGGIAVFQLSENPSSFAFNKPSNYRIVYVRRLESIVLAMKKIDYAETKIDSAAQRRLCGYASEAKKAALKNLEDVLLEPPRAASGKSRRYLKRTRYLPDLMGDSLESYPRRVFIDVGLPEKEGGSGTSWFAKNYPTRNLKFEMYKIETVTEESSGKEVPQVDEIGMSDWLKKNVKESEYVVMKAEAEVVEEMVKSKAIRFVDELFLECKPQGHGGNRIKRAYWECLALYGRLRDEGVAVHQWWG